MDTAILWRAALLQLIAVAALSLALGLALSHSFFEDWGWIAGPASWMACAAFTARILSLPLPTTLLGAVLAGLPSLAAVLVGLHWLGALLAVALFALWCARLPPPPRPAREWTANAKPSPMRKPPGCSQRKRPDSGAHDDAT